MAAPAPKRMSRDDRRASLLAAAARVVVGTPGERLSFETIATEAGVSPTLPYKYFESVDDVALELYEATVADVDSRTDQLLADSDLSFDEQVAAAFLLWCTQVERDDFLFVRLAEGANAAGLARTVSRRRERIIGVWAERIAPEFELDDTTARLIAASITSAASALVQRVFADRLDRHAVAELLVTLVQAQATAASSSLVGTPSRPQD